MKLILQFLRPYRRHCLYTILAMLLDVAGVRVIRAFNKESDEEKRMRKTFEEYAETSVSANLLFAGLESTAFFVINICIVAILWIGGGRIGAGFMEIIGNC